MMISPITSYNIPLGGYKNNQTKYTPRPAISFFGRNELIPPTNPNLQASLGEENVMILDKIRKIGENHKMETYLFGGGVRDSLMGKKAHDLDILVNGDAIEFTKHLEKEYGESFAKIKYKPHVKRVALETKSGTKIDIVPIAQDGSYAKERKALKSALEENVTRRDFSMNTMLIKLGSKKDGRLNLKFIDIKKARPDLKENVLRYVNKDFFLNNPVQVVRGVRFKTKYGMEIEEETQNLMQESIKNPRKGHVCKYYYKLFREFFRTLKAGNPIKGLTEIIKSKSYKLMFK